MRATRIVGTKVGEANMKSGDKTGMVHYQSNKREAKERGRGTAMIRAPGDDTITKLGIETVMVITTGRSKDAKLGRPHEAPLNAEEETQGQKRLAMRELKDEKETTNK